MNLQNFLWLSTIVYEKFVNKISADADVTNHNKLLSISVFKFQMKFTNLGNVPYGKFEYF